MSDTATDVSTDFDAVRPQTAPEEAVPLMLEPWQTADEAADTIRQRIRTYASSSKLDQIKIDLILLLLDKLVCTEANVDGTPVNLKTWSGVEHLLDHFTRVHVHTGVMEELNDLRTIDEAIKAQAALDAAANADVAVTAAQ